MTWRWAICFSLLPLYAGNVSGRVELRDSRNAAVRKRSDYSGVVVWLKPVAGMVPVRREARRATMLQTHKTFSPHVLAVSTGTVVDFPNLDPIFHNAFSSYSGQIFDIGLYAPGSTRSVQFTRDGVVRVFCNIHSAMSAVIVVLSTPYFATTTKDGSFLIRDVPAGDYELGVFHERATEAALRQLGRRIVVPEDSIVLPALDISEAGFLTVAHKNKYGRDYGPEPTDENVYPAVRK
jgi:plastocyanin